MTADTTTTQRARAFHLLRLLLLPWLIAAAFGLLTPGNAQAVGVPPSITMQPMSATTVVRGDASFHVWVLDDTGYGYQWQVDTGSGFTDISNGSLDDGVAYIGANTLDL